METSNREGRQNRHRPRHFEEGEEDRREGRRKDDKRKKDKYSTSRQKTTQSTSGAAGQAGFHRHREVPPRFQQHKQSKQQKYPKTSSTAVNKKQAKDSNRWQSPQPPSSTQPSSFHHQLTTNPNQPLGKPGRMDDDGGWSQGSPAKGSGWNSKVKSNLAARDHKSSQGSLGRDWGGSPEVEVVSAWTHSEHRHQASAGGSSGEGDGWNMLSPGQTNGGRHSQPDNWMSDEGSLSMGDNASSLQSNPSISPSGGWGASDGPQELEPIGDELDKELAQELDCPEVISDGIGGSGGVQFRIGTKEEEEEEEGEEGERGVGERGKAIRGEESWEDLDTASLSSSDKDTLVVGNSSTRLDPDNQSDNGSKTTSRSPSADMDQSADSHEHSRAKDKDSQRVSSEDSCGQQSQSSSTPEGIEMNMWKSRTSVGSTSSINSVGSNSSWKSEGKSFHGSYHSKPGTFSPRKSSRYDSQSSSASSTSGGKSRKGKKPTVALDDALETLHSEPSGWGDLPSPKPSDMDNGTEIWGVAPDDMHRKNKSSSWMDSQPLSGEWEDDSGTLAAGWMGQPEARAKGGRMPTPGTPSSSQWGAPHDGWGAKKSKQTNFADNVSKLMDMGFSRQMAEKYLKTNGNDLDATIGDLLAVGVVTDDGSLMGGANGRNNKKLGKSLSGTHSFGTLSSTMPGVSTPTGTTPGTSPSLNPKDLYYQQLMLNSLSALQQPQQSQQQPQQQQQQQQVPSNQMQAQLAQLQFLQMQQYLQLPTPPVLGYQQMLTHQLAQLKLAKHQVTQQLFQLQLKTSQSGGVASSQQQQQQQVLQTRLNLINQFISHINQQLLLQKFPGQQKEKGGSIPEGVKTTSSVMGSPQIGRNTPPCRNKDLKISGPIPSRSMSLPGGSSDHNLSLGMQGLNINGHPPPSSISQSSARSVSRLQQIISGSSSTENLQGMEDKSSSRFRLPPGHLSAATSEAFGSSSSPPAGTSSSTTTTPASTPFSPARSFNDIQEFRPGVPWQPRALPTEPAQVYAKTLHHQASAPDMRSMQNEPSYSQLPGQPFPQGGGMRPARRPPSLSTSYYNSSSTLPPGGFRARGSQSDKQQGWLSNSMPGPKGYLPVHSSINSPIAGSQFGGSSTPDNVFSPSAPPFGSRPKHHTLPPRPGGNPPFTGGGDIGQPPTRPQALFTGSQPFPSQPLAPPSSSSDMGSKWGSVGFSSQPSTSITSSVWNSSSSKPWNEGPHPSPSVADPGPRFTSPPLRSNTSATAGSSDRFASSLSSAWDKEGLQTSQPKGLMLSPEPTFAEWQAGKKAHLSVFKMPSNPPSEWLLIKNVNSQVDEASLRDVCNEFGRVQSVAINPSTESAIVKYTTKEDAMQAKSGLDKSPVICDVSVCVDFAMAEDVSTFYSQTQLAGSISSGPAQSTSQEKWFGSGKTNPASTATLMNGSRWDGVDLGRHAQTEASSTDARALWSNNTFLPGLSSPWANHRSPGSSAYPLGSAGEKSEEHPPMSSSPSLSTYLPNGLF